MLAAEAKAAALCQGANCRQRDLHSPSRDKAATLGGHELDGARPADARGVIASNLALDRPDDFGALAVGKVGVCEIVFGQDFGDLRIHRVDIALAVLPVELAERDGHLGSSLRLTRENIVAWR